VLSYSAVHGFWSVEEPVGGPTDCDEVLRGGCLVAGNLCLKISTVSMEELRRARSNVTCHCISDWPLSHRLKTPQVTTMHCTVIGRNLH
jgi:hypothetical protein